MLDSIGLEVIPFLWKLSLNLYTKQNLKKIIISFFSRIIQRLWRLLLPPLSQPMLLWQLSPVLFLTNTHQNSYWYCCCCWFYQQCLFRFPIILISLLTIFPLQPTPFFGVQFSLLILLYPLVFLSARLINSLLLIWVNV